MNKYEPCLFCDEKYLGCRIDCPKYRIYKDYKRRNAKRHSVIINMAKRDKKSFEI